MPTRWDEFQANITALEGGDPLAYLRATQAAEEAVTTAAEAFELTAELQLAEGAATRYDVMIHGITIEGTVRDHSRVAEEHLEAGKAALVNHDPDRAREQLAASIRRFEAAIALLPEPQP